MNLNIKRLLTHSTQARDGNHAGCTAKWDPCIPIQIGAAFLGRKNRKFTVEKNNYRKVEISDRRYELIFQKSYPQGVAMENKHFIDDCYLHAMVKSESCKICSSRCVAFSLSTYSRRPKWLLDRKKLSYKKLMFTFRQPVRNPAQIATLFQFLHTSEKQYS